MQSLCQRAGLVRVTYQNGDETWLPLDVAFAHVEVRA